MVQKIVQTAHERNLVEQVAILALTHLAGLANEEGGEFLVEPATSDLDRNAGFDCVIHRQQRDGGKRLLLVDATSSQRYQRAKIARVTEGGKKPRKLGWRFILKVDWNTAVFDVAGIGTDQEKCFKRTYLLISDGVPKALREACIIHGNSCDFARSLREFGLELNRQIASHRRRSGRLGQAAEFEMKVS